MPLEQGETGDRYRIIVKGYAALGVFFGEPVRIPGLMLGAFSGSMGV